MPPLHSDVLQTLTDKMPGESQPAFLREVLALTYRRRLDWIAATFTDGGDAETDLSMDRPKFLQCRDIMALIPERIKGNITHSGHNEQIGGFQDLFLYLKENSAAMELRQLVTAYFASCPELRSHLSMSSVTVGDLKSQCH